MKHPASPKKVHLNFFAPLLIVIGILTLVVLFLGLTHFLKQKPVASSSSTSYTAPEVIDGSTWHPCNGNKEDQCKAAQSIDFYPGGSEGATNPEYKGDGGVERMKEITGRIKDINGQSITLQTSSGRLFTVDFPVDAVTVFNTMRSPNYQNIQVVIGDTLHIDYSEPAAPNDTHITAAQLFSSNLLLKDNNPKLTDKIEKY